MGDPAPPPEEAPRPCGAPQVAERMRKRTCALCPRGLECSVLYLAQSENLAAHENCLLYSSALVECENNSPHGDSKSFDVESVKKEIRRGRRLKCSFCGEKGASVGCDVRACFKKYHFVCAENDAAVFLSNEALGIYRVLCREHAASRDPTDDLRSSLPNTNIFHDHFIQMTCPRPEVKRKRGKKRRLLSGIPAQTPVAMAAGLSTQTEEEDEKYADTTAKAVFFKKCKEAGLLDDLFEEMLDKLHLTQERLMEETASESEYEEIGTWLFECRLFADTFTNFQAVIEHRLRQQEERQAQLKEETLRLQNLKQTLCSAQDASAVRSSSPSTSSLCELLPQQETKHCPRLSMGWEGNGTDDRDTN